MGIPQITPAQLAGLIETYHQAQIPLFLWGSPGIGKSSLIHQYAKNIDALVVDVRLSQFDPVDLRGLPAPSGDSTRWLAPSILPFTNNPNFPTNRPIILFLDELAQASPAVQAAAFQMVLDRRVGEHTLMSNVYVIAASNRSTDRAGINRLATPLLNRFAHIEVISDFDAWKQWAIQAGIHPLIVGFLSQRPALLDKFEDALKSGAQAFPTPRSWHFLSSLLNSLPDISTTPLHIISTLVASAVGDAVAAEFVAFVESAYILPSWEEIIAAPQKARVPNHDQPDALYAVSSLLIVRVDEATADAVVEYASRLPAEFQTLIASDLARSKPALATRNSKVKQMIVSAWRETVAE